jgi:hypothetical protein
MPHRDISFPLLLTWTLTIYPYYQILGLCCRYVIKSHLPTNIFSHPNLLRRPARSSQVDRLGPAFAEPHSPGAFADITHRPGRPPRSRNINRYSRYFPRFQFFLLLHCRLPALRHHPPSGDFAAARTPSRFPPCSRPLGIPSNINTRAVTRLNSSIMSAILPTGRLPPISIPERIPGREYLVACDVRESRAAITNSNRI